ncbi:hypothetical protein TNCV_4647421 [Trichonephila clavipes]|uniref:Uncharacterized protein n=1 Tax=Trichonephila clavipes TaxID=2585209 RepID=A0A8X6SX47_TRICX|nr:hypothetical protein TNCV_4647421 [Trichonephila clavipes]
MRATGDEFHYFVRRGRHPAFSTSTPRTAVVAEWNRYRIVAGFVTNSGRVPLKTHRVGQRCTLTQWSSGSVSRFHTTGPGSIPDWARLTQPFIPTAMGRQMSTKLSWGLASDRPPDWDICSCTSAPNGHVY